MRPNFVLPSLAMLGALVSGQLRIVNGRAVDIAFKYPWMAAIIRYEQIHCGGTALTKNKVITAAHCMAGARAPLDTFKVHLHRHNVDTKPEEEEAVIHNVVRRWVADKYDPDTLYNDVAIIEIDAPGTQATEIKLDRQRTHADGEVAIALGWGATRQGGRHSGELQEAGLPIMAPARCASMYRKSEDPYRVRKSQICTLAQNGSQDTCQGDSGGPLFSIGLNGPTLIGVTSSGLSCADANSPGLYSRVTSFRPWILDVLAGRIDPTPDQERSPLCTVPKPQPT